MSCGRFTILKVWISFLCYGRLIMPMTLDNPIEMIDAGREPKRLTREERRDNLEYFIIQRSISDLQLIVRQYALRLFLSPDEKSDLYYLVKESIDNEWTPILDSLCEKELIPMFDPILQEGNTPLLYALLQGKNQSAKCLLGKENVDNVNYLNSSGQSALEVACLSENVSSRVVDFLLANGANKYMQVYNAIGQGTTIIEVMQRKYALQANRVSKKLDRKISYLTSSQE